MFVGHPTDIGGGGAIEKELSVDVRENDDGVDGHRKHKEEWEDASNARTPNRGTRSATKSGEYTC